MQKSQTLFISHAAIRVLTEMTIYNELKQAVDELIAEWERLLNWWDEEEDWLAAVLAIDVGMVVNRIRVLKTVWKILWSQS